MPIRKKIGKKRSNAEKGISRAELSKEVLTVLKYWIAEGLTPLKKSHTADVFRGNKKIVQKIRKKKSKKVSDKDFLRHLSTAIQCHGVLKDNEYVEVQSALKKKEKIIYISANNNESYLPNKSSDIKVILNDIDKDQKKKNSKIDLSIREKGHLEKLKKEMVSYKDYNLFKIEGKQGIHAEMKIIDEVSDLDTLAGVRRPCLACFLRLKIKKIKAKVYNAHAGAFWATKNALIPLANDIADDMHDDVIKKLSEKKNGNVTAIIEDIISDNYDDIIERIKKTYACYCDRNEKPQLDNDSDSEDEYV